MVPAVVLYLIVGLFILEWAACISVKLSKTFGGLLEIVVEQRIWLFPVWLTAARINTRQDLTSWFTGMNHQLYKNSLVDCQHEHALVPSV